MCSTTRLSRAVMQWGRWDAVENERLVLDQLALFSPKIYCFVPHITIFPVKKEEVTW